MKPETTMQIVFEADGLSCPIICDGDVPRTLAAFAQVLPLQLQLHTPKIAGNHIFWHVPFVEEVEGGVDVLSAPPGALIYWPVRQFMEITFAPLQAETASVTVLGRIDAPVTDIAELGERLRLGAGTRRFTGHLTRTDGQQVETMPVPDVPSALHKARLALWRDCPVDIAGLIASRAILHPIGPLMQADAEARVLHEALWWMRARLGREPEGVLRTAACLSLDRAAVRLRDFCHLPDSAATLFAARDAIENTPYPLPALLDEAILIAGRIAAWIDLLIPWNAMNEAARAALDNAKETRIG
jgi:hypothetical protein